MFRKIINTFGVRLASAIFNLLIAIVVSQFLGPAGKGEQGIIITTIAFMLLFANFVGGASLVYLVPRHNIPLLALPAYGWSILTAGMFYLLLRFTGIVEGPYHGHLALLALFNSAASIHSTFLLGRQRIGASNFIIFLQPVITLAMLILFFGVFNQCSIQYYLYSLYAAYIVSAIAGAWLLRKEFSGFRFAGTEGYRQVVLVLFRFGTLNQLAHIFQLMSFRLSFYLLEYYQGADSVGIYSNGASLLESVWLISKSIAMVQYSRIANSDDVAYNQRITMLLTRVSLMASIVLIIPILLLPSGFWLFLFGDGFEGVSKVMLTLAPGVMFFNIALLVGHYFSGTGRYRINTISSMAGFIATILLSVWWIPLFGLAGAGWAASVSYVITSLVVMMYYLREPGTSWSDLQIRSADISGLKVYLKEYMRTLRLRNH